jgi:membrane protein implicated in regulation of membrane protease activity
MLVGLSLLGVELLTPGGFYVLFFGVGALVVGGLVGIGAVSADWLEWLLFSMLSVASLLFFRRPLMERFAPATPADRAPTMVGEIAVLLDDLAPGAVGRAELRGTVWSVRSRDEHPLARAARVRVLDVEGLTLSVRAE